MWCLYDFGNSAYPTIIMTAVYALYFSEVVVPEGESSDEWWGLATGLGALFVVLAAPFLGGLADHARAKRKFLIAHVILGVSACALLTLTGAGDLSLAVVLVVVSLYAFEGGNVFYNAFLPELVEEKDIPRLGARGWAFGYVGGLISLGVVILLLKLGVDMRYAALVAAVWWIGFAMPALLTLRDAPLVGHREVRAGVIAQLKKLRNDPELFRFVIALFFYMNAVSTIFVFAALFTRQSLGFSETESIFLILMLNIVAAPGSLIFGRLAEKVGTLRSIALSLVVWIFVVLASIATAWPGLFEPDTAKNVFWVVAALAALCIGATQATSRSYVAELAKPGMSGEYFGVMAIAGRASAVLGPIVFGKVSSWSGGDQRAALGTVGGFFLLGLILLARCRQRERGT